MRVDRSTAPLGASRTKAPEAVCDTSRWSQPWAALVGRGQAKRRTSADVGLVPCRWARIGPIGMPAGFRPMGFSLEQICPHSMEDLPIAPLAPPQWGGIYGSPIRRVWVLVRSLPDQRPVPSGRGWRGGGEPSTSRPGTPCPPQFSPN